MRRVFLLLSTDAFVKQYRAKSMEGALVWRWFSKIDVLRKSGNSILLINPRLFRGVRGPYLLDYRTGGFDNEIREEVL